MSNELAVTEPTFFVGFSVGSLQDGFEIVCILTSKEDCEKYGEEEKTKPYRMGVWSIQELTMGQIKEIVLKDALHERLTNSIKQV